jgi:hypothetical protein
MSDPKPPCECHECVLANAGRPSVTIPGCRYREPEELHGVRLKRYYEAQDELKATIARILGRRELPSRQRGAEAVGEASR